MANYKDHSDYSTIEIKKKTKSLGELGRLKLQWTSTINDHVENLFSNTCNNDDNNTNISEMS